ncbi:EpsG family protein [Weissella cibaria]|uniref:EpsG family protein n=1 Tax=Weissella cibaria TaxID=137591 RepID=UPI00223A94A1|nr:EpsG family protein [Weissella cibaria]MCT0021413.1 EpsG family protein [Weissella cibaria]
MKLYLSMFAILLVGIIFFTQLDYLISGGRINRGTYGKNNKVLSLLFLVGVTIMLVYVAGNRYGVGSDYYAYYSAFNLNISSSFESGYVHLQNLFTADNNPFNVFTVFLSLLTVGMISASIWISGSSAYLAMYLYFTTYLYFYSMNGMRQFLAMSMITLATALTFKITRNVFIRILLLCVLTPLIANYHASVNLVLPVLIIAVLLSVAKEKVYGKIFWFGMILAILMPSINIEGILQTSLFEGFIGKYTGYLDSSLNNRLDMAHLLQMYAKLAVMGVVRVQLCAEC